MTADNRFPTGIQLWTKKEFEDFLASADRAGYNSSVNVIIELKKEPGEEEYVCSRSYGPRRDRERIITALAEAQWFRMGTPNGTRNGNTHGSNGP